MHSRSSCILFEIFPKKLEQEKMDGEDKTDGNSGISGREPNGITPFPSLATLKYSKCFSRDIWVFPPLLWNVLLFLNFLAGCFLLGRVHKDRSSNRKASLPKLWKTMDMVPSRKRSVSKGLKFGLPFVHYILVMKCLGRSCFICPWKSRGLKCW